MSAPFPIDRKDLTEGLGKGLRVIEAFDAEYPRLTATEVAARADISRAAARRYLLSLCHYGYAATDGKHFWLLARVMRLGHSFLSASPLARAVQPVLQRIAVQCGETVTVSTLDGQDVIYITRSASPRHVSIGFSPGARVPAHLVAPGLAMLSTYAEAALHEWIASHRFTSYTAHTVSDPEQFRLCVQASRTLDYGYCEQQLDLGLAGIAVPLRDRRAECCAAIGITVQLRNHSRDQAVERLLPLLREAAQSIRAVL
jgi:IclR family pca regulon transcriptional regulator